MRPDWKTILLSMCAAIPVALVVIIITAKSYNGGHGLDILTFRTFAAETGDYTTNGNIEEPEFPPENNEALITELRDFMEIIPLYDHDSPPEIDGEEEPLSTPGVISTPGIISTPANIPYSTPATLETAGVEPEPYLEDETFATPADSNIQDYSTPSEIPELEPIILYSTPGDNAAIDEGITVLTDLRDIAVIFLYLILVSIAGFFVYFIVRQLWHIIFY